MVAPVSKKHGRLVDRERAKLAEQYRDTLGLGEIRREAEVSENAEKLEGAFVSFGNKPR